MPGPENSNAMNNDNPAAALEALGNAARAYATLAPNLAAAGAYPPLGVDASALLVNPAAAVAAVAAAAAKHLAAQRQGNAANAPAPPIPAAAPAVLTASFGHHPHAVNHGHTTPSPAAALAAASALLPNAAGALQGAAALNHVSALLQSVGQQVTQAQAHSLATVANTVAAAGTPTPPPATSFSPPPPQPAPPSATFPQQRAVSELTTTSPGQSSFTVPAQVVASHAASTTMPSSALLPNIQNWSLEQLGKFLWY